MSALSPAARSRLTREISKTVRSSQQARIAAQKNPDGSKYTQRQSVFVQKNKPKSFVYLDKKRIIKSYRDEGDRFTGYDIQSGGIRTFLKPKITKWLRAPGASAPAIAPGATKKLRRPMFGKLRSSRHIRIKSNEHSAALEISGSATAIATVHQYGLRDRVNNRGTTVQYPSRQLLGLTDDDVAAVREIILHHLSL